MSVALAGATLDIIAPAMDAQLHDVHSESAEYDVAHDYHEQ